MSAIRCGGSRCQARTLIGPRVDAWRLRVMSPWAGYVGRRYVRYIQFTWKVSGRVVGKRCAWIWE